MRYFRPNPRATNVLVLLGCAALGLALYLRLGVVEARHTELHCAAGLTRAICGVRWIAIRLYEWQFYGGLALLAACAHFWRPGLIAFSAALTAAIFGLVLYNQDLSALAMAVLVIAFARPVPARPPRPAPPASPRTTAPGDSKLSH